MDYGMLDIGRGLGILANTAGSLGEFSFLLSVDVNVAKLLRIGKNNARFSWHRNSRELRLIAITNVAPGAEILAGYGRGYSGNVVSAVRKQRVAADLAAEEIAPVVWSRGAVKRMLCAKCRKVVTKSNRLLHARCCFGRC
jgi:hypothetical protein